MSMDKYSDEESQKKLQTYLDAANKEATYADDNLSKFEINVFPVAALPCKPMCLSKHQVLFH